MSNEHLVKPPPDYIPVLTARVQAAAASLSPTARGGVFAIGDETQGNAAVVIRKGEGLQVVTWIGKEWRKPGARVGAALKWEF